MLGLALVLLAANSYLEPISGQYECVCGTKRVLLVLAEFPEVQHLSSRLEIGRIFFGQVARYFADVSYGKLAIEGNVTDWITLPRLYEQYSFPSQQSDLVAIARDSFSAAAQTFNFTSFDGVLLVLSFYPSLTTDYVPLTSRIMTRTGPVGAFAVIEEDRDWSVYARSTALMIGLWNNRNKLSGLGQLDIASGGQGDMSAWSKMLLGWINETQITTFTTPARRILFVNPIEMTGAETLAVRIALPQSGDQYLIEVRQPLGYDVNTLQEYGVVILFEPSTTNASLQLRAILQPDDVGRAIFRDLNRDLSIIALNQTETGVWILVGVVQDWRDAQRTLYAMSRANDAINTAESQNRIEGLDLANRLLDNAHTLLSVGRFREAEALALSAETTASSANIPSDYYQAVQLITNAESLKTETQALVSSESLALVVRGTSELESAKQAFITKNFTTAKQSAQAAIDLFNRAKQIDLTQRILDILGDIALIIPVAVLAYALRYQLKNK